MSAAVCDLCRERPTFYTIPLVGVVWQRCGCGEIPMRPHVDVPVEIPPPLVTEAWTRPAVCEMCGREFRTLAHRPGTVCSQRCRGRRARDRRRVTRKCRQCRALYQDRVDVPTRTCTRCRKREDMRQRRLAKIAARAA